MKSYVPCSTADAIINYVPLSHLRSKEYQGTHVIFHSPSGQYLDIARESGLPFVKVVASHQVSRDSAMTFLVHGSRSTFSLARRHFNLRDIEHAGLGSSSEDSCLCLLYTTQTGSIFSVNSDYTNLVIPFPSYSWQSSLYMYSVDSNLYFII